MPKTNQRPGTIRRLLFVMASTFCCAVHPMGEARASTNAGSRADWPLTKEPTYQSTPKYSLLALGDRGDVKVWMVEDGRRLFVDKNANGDLTDDGPPIQPSKLRNVSPGFWDFEYALDAITPANGPRHTNFVLRRWNYNEKADSYGLSLSVGGKLPMYAGWFGTFWSKDRNKAPVIHFGGPFTPKLLRRKEFILAEKGQRLSLGFFNPGSGPGTESRLSIEALPRLVNPALTIEWPTAGDGSPLRTTHELSQRCCYWEFYTTEFTVPRSAVAGNAKIIVEMDHNAVPIELTTTEINAPVVGR